MNFEHVVGTIVSKGFTERQARFLVLVARHLGWVATYDCARIYHVRHAGTSKLGEPVATRTLCQTMTSAHTGRDCDGSPASSSPRSTRSGSRRATTCSRP